MNIGSKISSAINPFKGTVNTEETSREGLKFLGVKITSDNSMGNFTLRKIYNSIVNAPGHAFNAVGLKSFTNYLYPGTTGEEAKKAAAATKIQALHRGNMGREEAVKAANNAVFKDVEGTGPDIS